MPTTPLLGITQLTASQNSKEVTINDAITALENATNRALEVDYSAATNVNLTDNQATRNFIYRLVSATADSTLTFPVDINGSTFNRIFAVRNESGYGITVKFESGAGTTVVIPNNQTRLIGALEGLNMIVAAEPQAAVNFLSLSDTPNTFTGANGKFLSANLAENALEFVDAATFPAYASHAGHALVVNGTEDGVEWVDIAAVAAFTDLTDAPADYTGAGGKLVAVKATEDGIEFIDVPEAEAVEFASATRWRIRVIEPGTESQVGFGEIELKDVNGNDQTGTGTATATTEDTGKEIAYAFDDDTTAGNGWLSEDGFIGDIEIEYEFTSAETIRSITFYPINGFPGYTPTRIAFDYHNGDDWVEVGDRITADWVDNVPQTFKVNGTALSSLPEAPNDGNTYARRNLAWVAISPGIEEAPINGSLYARQDGDWTAFTQGISDAPADGFIYGRQDNGWVLALSYPSFTGNDGKHLAVNATEDGVEWVDPVFDTFSENLTVAAASSNLLAANAGRYHRFTAATAKTLTVQPDATEALPAHGEWPLRNVGAENLTIVAGSGVTITPPYGGTLVLAPAMSATLKRVTTNIFELIGHTVAAA